MVRPLNTVRSRGCATCKKRRIKCDLTTPTCQRCLESGRECTGPETGLFIVDSRPSVDQRPRETARTKPRKFDNHDEYLHRTHQHDKLNTVLIDDESVHYRICVPSTPNPASIQDDVLLWKFMSFFSENVGQKAWLTRLPTLLKPDYATSLRTAARAVSLAYAAKVTENPSALAVAYQFYGQSLHQHRRSLSNISGPKSVSPAATHALSVTVLLSYFEMIFATSPEAWIRHTLGAEQLIVLLGPDAMKDDFINHIYFMVRSHAAVRSFLYGVRSELSEGVWFQIPNLAPCGLGWDVHNSVLDLIMWASDAISNAENERKEKVTKGFKVVDPFDRLALEATLEELQLLWTQFAIIFEFNAQSHPLLLSTGFIETPFECTASTQNIQKSSNPTPYLIYPEIEMLSPSTWSSLLSQPTMFDQVDSSPSDGSEIKSENSTTPPTSTSSSESAFGTFVNPDATETHIPPQLRTPSGALTASYIHTAVILLLHLLNLNLRKQQQKNRTDDAPSTDSPIQNILPSNVTDSHNYESQITIQAGFILKHSLYLSKQHIGCACARGMLPLTAVCRFSPDSEQRVASESLFRRWCQEDGLSGLVCVAFPD